MNLSALWPLLAQVVEAATGSKWGVLMILLSSWVVQLLSQDSKFPISLPKSWGSNQWKPVAVLVASMVQAILAGIIQKHLDPVHAILMGLRTTVWTLGGWALLIKAIYDGKPPKWMDYLALIFPEPDPVQQLASARVDRDAVTLSGKDEFPKLPPHDRE